MAAVAKKKRKARSPKHDTASKRTRKDSSNVSLHSQAIRYDALMSHTGPARGSSLPRKQDRETSLPTGEDWLFRVKVISAATDLADDLFKNAVQGLVRICFPDGILDQLGLHVLEQHMREENAPIDNIQRMSEIFKSEMIQRLTSMLAEHLDTPPKVDLAVHATVAASARLHGEQKLGEDILSHVSATLLQLKARAPEDSTEWLASGDELHNTASSHSNIKIGDVSEKKHTPPPKANKAKTRDKKHRLFQPTTSNLSIDDHGMDNDAPAPPLGKNASEPIRPMHKGKDGRISTKWQWNIKPEEHTDDVPNKVFTRTGDLFAYHALSFAKQKLGAEASRKELRMYMQAMLDGMHIDEFGKWVESLQKLLNGDYEMLKRSEPSASDIDQKSSRATPAPIEMRKRAKRTAKANIEGVDNRSYDGKTIKRETADSHYLISKNVHEEAPEIQVARTTNTLRQLLTEERGSRPPVTSVEPYEPLEGTKGYSSSGNMDSDFGMPVLSLLWGSDSLTPDQCINDSVKITQTIMGNLHNRVSADRIVVSGLGGKNKTRTKSELHSAIANAFPEPGHRYTYMKIKKNIEASLVPWVIAEPSAFPELKAMPFVFAHMLPSVSVMLTLLFGPWANVAVLNGSQMWDIILRAVQQRGVSEASLGAANIDCLQIDSLCDNEDFADTTRRALLERVLRRLAFAHRDKFLELRSTPVVKTWERKTGLVW